MYRCSRGLYALLAAGALLLFSSSPASAQFTPRTLNDPATGEQFHVEGTIGFWSPNANMNVSSDQFGISGSSIDFKRDLGLVDHKFTEMHLLFKPARKQAAPESLQPCAELYSISEVTDCRNRSRFGSRAPLFKLRRREEIDLEKVRFSVGGRAVPQMLCHTQTYYKECRPES